MENAESQPENIPVKTPDEAREDIRTAALEMAEACTNAVNSGVPVAEVMTLASQALMNPLGG